MYIPRPSYCRGLREILLGKLRETDIFQGKFQLFFREEGKEYLANAKRGLLIFVNILFFHYFASNIPANS